MVPPAAPVDDVFSDVGAGADCVYRWQVPGDHAQGTHWYHPRSHGLLGGSLRMRPGQRRARNLGTLGVDAYFDLAADGVLLREINREGHVLIQPRLPSSVFLPPGSRSTVVAVAPPRGGCHAVRMLDVDTGRRATPIPTCSGPRW